MVTKEKNQVDDPFEGVEETLSRTEQYIEENQKSLTIIVAAIILIVGGYLAYKNFYVAPMEKRAQAEMFMAERYFEKDSFNLALNGDGNYEGFLTIIDNYGATKTANLASYYAGISYLKLGQYDEAISYLSDFSSSDELIWPLAITGIGDAHMELGDTDAAIKHYKKAATTNKNDFTTPVFLMKLAFAYEQSGDVSKALETYQNIKDDFPKSNEASQVEKYIARLQ